MMEGTEMGSSRLQFRNHPFFVILRRKHLLCLTVVVIFSFVVFVFLLSAMTGFIVFGSIVGGFICIQEITKTTFQKYLRKIRNSYLLQRDCTKQKPTFTCETLKQMQSEVCSKVLMDRIFVAKEVDEAIEQFLKFILEKFIYVWYREITEDGSFLYELKDSIQCLITMLFRRSQMVDLSTLVTRKLLHPCLSHLDCCLEARQRIKNVPLEEAIINYYGGDLHVAIYSRSAELHYLQGLCESVLPHLLPSRYLNSSAFKYLIRELFGSTILLSVMDLFADPVVVNMLLGLLFDKTLTTRFPKSAPKMVILLDEFVKDFPHRSQTKLGEEVACLSTQRGHLYPFMKFLKNEGTVGILQFCLAVEDFNNKLLNPDLNKEDIRSLHQEAKKLYETYMSPHGVYRLNFSRDVVEKFRIVIEGPNKRVVELRTTGEFYKAYKYALNLLELNVPMFRQSDEYFEHLCGPRVLKRSIQTSNTASRKSNYLSTVAMIGNKINKIRGVLVPVRAIEGRMEDDLQSDMADAGFEADEMKIEGEMDDFSLRDLNAWRVSIPKVCSEEDGNGKSYLAFVIDVQRIDVMNKDNPEENHWVVKRKYQEFYVLESKLTEFHGTGEFVDIHLPVKRSFGKKGFEYMESRRAAFEEFLQRLLQMSIFRGSELLFTFLSSSSDFTTGILPEIKLGRIIKNVPMKLVKERGQHLDGFLQNFFISTEHQKAKSNKTEYRDVCTNFRPLTMDESRLFKSLLLDNTVIESSHNSRRLQRSKFVIPQRNLCDYVTYMWLKVVEIPRWSLHFVLPLLKCFGSQLEEMAEDYLELQLRQALTHPRIVVFIHLLKDAIFLKRNLGQTETERAVIFEEALLKAKRFLPQIIVRLVGQDKHDKCFKAVFELLQHPHLNKQLLYTLLDLWILDLFPELNCDYASSRYISEEYRT